MRVLIAPDESGWWKWYEGGDTDGRSELVLVSVNHIHGQWKAEIAGEDEFEEATGIDVEKELRDGFSTNYWEATDCEEMGGLWVKATEQEVRRQFPDAKKEVVPA
jgi:hypothetical protein